MNTDTNGWRDRVAVLAETISNRLSQLVHDRRPAALYEPVQYVLSKGGKRFRPVLVLLAADAFGIDSEEAMPLALAVELVHEFSLVHDDIMDHADSRRGRPTVHVKYDVDTAILCGDTLLNLATSMIADVTAGSVKDHVKCLSHAVESLCEGQALDKQYETASGLQTADYLRMVDLKTGALTAACLELAGIAGGVNTLVRSRLRSSGLAMGRAFQIQDDLLDLVADDARWGKVIGSDLMEGKKTFLLLEAQARSTESDGDFFGKIHQGAGLDASQIVEARRRMDSLGVLEASRDAIAKHTDQAIVLLGLASGHTSDVQLLVRSMAERVW